MTTGAAGDRKSLRLGSTSSVDEVLRATDAGIDRLIVSPWQRTREALDGIARFADEYFDISAAIG
jgi:phosphohistidine phosphatase SixA